MVGEKNKSSRKNPARTQPRRRGEERRAGAEKVKRPNRQTIRFPQLFDVGEEEEVEKGGGGGKPIPRVL